MFCSCLSSLLIAECVNDQIDLGGLCCFSNQVNDNGQCQDSCDSPKIDNEGVCHCPAALIENDYDGECSKCCSWMMMGYRVISTRCQLRFFFQPSTWNHTIPIKPFR